ncbi:beta-1,6-N-acetylglucosaminyltransferase [Paracoccus sp. MC1854]|uniref:beta-1,6-N-acetylglucosaminyltransferase n=1 Tax=Paracoccus sp. MC1854 TaxID=2760306 RepID=UPI002102914D|nr:beta-1,6-N-acetylglucosaminyltransferase [Paracoccus sp. MC1854]
MNVAPIRRARPAGDASPEAAVCLGVVMLCHENLALAARMARIWSNGGARVVIHVDAKAPASEMAGLRQALEGTGVLYAPRRSCTWGTFSLVAATQDAAAMLLDAHPEVSHVFLASGACLPLRPVRELGRFLAAHPQADFIESVSVRDVGWTMGGLNEERFTLHFPFSFRRRRKLFDRYVRLQRRLGIARRLPDGIKPHVGSQWWCLTRQTLSAILNDPRRAEFDRYFRHVWIPDESYFQTLMRRHSVRIESRSLTLAKFDAQGKPYVFYDDHLALLATSHIFVARKIWPGAKALYDSFPRRTDPDSAEDEPDTERIEALLDRAAARRRLGRPGLYMQSRFPRKDAENGKTSQPYVVIYGAGDMFDGFADHAATATGRTVHGHVLARHTVEFAGDAPIGPGALPSHVGLRNLDPQGFLAALIRSSEDMPAFLYSPRDRQHLNWFMATDPNAQLLVVTGAWIVPLIHSDMPFDNVRHIAAKLQRAEVRFLDILDSVWVKARVRRWSLAEALGQPDELWSEICMALRPEGGADQSQAPPMRDMTGVMRLIRDLRNAGLRPRKMGNPRILRALTRQPSAVGEDAISPAESGPVRRAV